MSKIPVMAPAGGGREPVLLGSVSYDYLTVDTPYQRMLALTLSRPMSDFRLVLVEAIDAKTYIANPSESAVAIVDAADNVLVKVNVGNRNAPKSGLNALFIAPGGGHGYYGYKSNSSGTSYQQPSGDYTSKSLRLYDDSNYLGSGTIKVWGVV